MKKVAYILSFIFLSFLTGPTVVTLIDHTVDVSYVFTANEEENSSKNLLSFESTVGDHTYSNHNSIHFLRTQKNSRYSYLEDYHQVYLDVVSPPPKSV